MLNFSKKLIKLQPLSKKKMSITEAAWNIDNYYNDT